MKTEAEKRKLKKQRLVGLLIAFGVLVLCCGLATCWALRSMPSVELQPSPTWAPLPTLTPTLKPTETPTPEPIKTPTVAPTLIPKPTSTIMLLLSPTPVPTLIPTSVPTPEPSPAVDFSAWYCPITLEGAAYVGAVGSDKFHTLSCRHVRTIAPENRICFASREAAIADNRIPCKHCKP